MATVKQQVAMLRARMVARRDVFRAMSYLLSVGFAFAECAKFVAYYSVGV